MEGSLAEVDACLTDAFVEACASFVRDVAFGGGGAGLDEAGGIGDVDRRPLKRDSATARVVGGTALSLTSGGDRPVLLGGLGGS